MDRAVDEISQVGGYVALGEGSDGGVVEAGSIELGDGRLVVDERFEDLETSLDQDSVEHLRCLQAHVSAPGLVRPTEGHGFAENVCCAQKRMKRCGGLRRSEEDDGPRREGGYSRRQEGVGEVERRERVGVLWKTVNTSSSRRRRSAE